MTNDPRDVDAARRAYRYPPFVPTWDEAGTVPKSLIAAAKYAREAAEARLGPGGLSPEELDEARYKEARKCGYNADVSLAYYRQLVRTGWTPPPYVDPDLLAAREIAADYWRGQSDREYAGAISAGKHDEATFLKVALAAYKAGKEAAR